MDAAPRRQLRAVLPLALAVVALAAVPALAGAFDEEIAALRDDIADHHDLIGDQEDLIADHHDRIGDQEDLIADHHDRIGELEGDLVDLDHQIAETDDLIGDEATELRILEVRLELLADRFARILTSRDEPAFLHRTMAVDAYLQNNERMNAVLTQSAHLANDALEGVRDQIIYDSVIEEAQNRLDLVDAELRLAADSVRGLHALKAEAEQRRVHAMSSRSATEDAKPAVREAIGRVYDDIADARSTIANLETRILEQEAQIPELEAQIQELEAQIQEFERLDVTRTWAGLQGNDIPRPALAIKIDNVTRAHPQSGVNQADVVYEELVEGGVTRLVAVFQSTSAETVGPIRSARTSDPQLLSGFDRPLFAYSGANRGTRQELATSSMVDVGYSALTDDYWRDKSRRPPHNLYVSPDTLWAHHTDRTGVPPAPFLYRHVGQAHHPDAEEAAGVNIDFGLTEVDYEWDGTGWARTHGGNPHVDHSGTRVAPANVVVQFISYGWSKADSRSPEARTTGSGEAWVFTDGHVVRAQWSRPDEALPAVFTADGKPVRLTPGNTWVALAKSGTADWWD